MLLSFLFCIILYITLELLNLLLWVLVLISIRIFIIKIIHEFTICFSLIIVTIEFIIKSLIMNFIVNWIVFSWLLFNLLTKVALAFFILFNITFYALKITLLLIWLIKVTIRIIIIKINIGFFIYSLVKLLLIKRGFFSIILWLEVQTSSIEVLPSLILKILIIIL